MKKLICLLLAVVSVAPTFAQTKKSLQTGVVFPYKENEFLNQRLLQHTRRDNKKVIIDLFNSGCIVCFRMLPKIQGLQKKFESKLEFVMLGNEDAHIRKIYNRFNEGLGLDLDVVYDSVFFKKYNVSFVPNYIWLDEAGNVAAVTGPDEINENNIRRFIEGDPVVAKPILNRSLFSPDKLLLRGGNGGNDTNFLFRSVLSLYDSSLRPYTPLRLEYEKNTTMFQALGVTMSDLYCYAYFGRGRWNLWDTMYGEYARSPVIVQDEALDLRTRYSYSFKSPDQNKQLLQRALRNDLATFFGYDVVVTRWNMPCWKLIAKPGAAKKLRTRYSKPFTETSYVEIDLRAVPVSALLENLYLLRTDDLPPYIDATGIDFPIDIRLSGMLTDPLELGKALDKSGLSLIKAEKEMWTLMLIPAQQKSAIAAK